jgi:hypothetical protein
MSDLVLKIDLIFVGGEVTTGKIRNIILKLQFKEDAQMARLKKEGFYDEVVIKIKSNVKPFVYIPPKGVLTIEGVKGEKVEGIVVKDSNVDPNVSVGRDKFLIRIYIFKYIYIHKYK